MSGSKILITGGSRDIGEALVRRLAAAGDRVTFTCASSEVRALATETGATARRVDSAHGNTMIAAIASEGAIDPAMITGSLQPIDAGFVA